MSDVRELINRLRVATRLPRHLALPETLIFEDWWDIGRELAGRDAAAPGGPPATGGCSASIAMATAPGRRHRGCSRSRRCWMRRRWLRRSSPCGAAWACPSTTMSRSHTCRRPRRMRCWMPPTTTAGRCPRCARRSCGATAGAASGAERGSRCQDAAARSRRALSATARSALGAGPPHTHPQSRCDIEMRTSGLPGASWRPIARGDVPNAAPCSILRRRPALREFRAAAKGCCGRGSADPRSPPAKPTAPSARGPERGGRLSEESASRHEWSFGVARSGR